MSDIPAAIEAIRAGKMVVVADDRHRENEGDLILAASCATPEAIAFIVRHTSGVICVSLEGKRLEQLWLQPMVADNQDAHGTAFAVSVDYKHGTTTGISAADRSATIRALTDEKTQATDFARPGHIFPLRAREGGVLRRPGHTEAAIDLARLAGLPPAGVLCELVNEDGTMMRGVALKEFAEHHGLPFISIADLIAYRRRNERIVSHTATARMPTKHGEFIAHVYRSEIDGVEHVALVRGKVRGRQNVLVRVHSECFTGDILSSLRCDCGAQLDQALSRIAEAGEGVVVYLRGQEGRGIGLTHKLRAYALQDQGRDTVEANLDQGLPVDSRTYDVGAQILTDLGLRTIRVMSNNPAKFTQLAGYDLRIVERVPLLTEPTCENLSYLRAKQLKLGHTLNLTALGQEGTKVLDVYNFFVAIPD